MQHDQNSTVTTAAVGFASGDRIVVKVWEASPIGHLVAVMWAERDNWRTLFVASQAAADLVCLTHEFDTVVVDPGLSYQFDGRRVMVAWSQAQLECAIGRATMPVPSRSAAPTWRSPDLARRITGGWAIAAGRDLGPIGPPTHPCGFGQKEPAQLAMFTTSSAFGVRR